MKNKKTIAILILTLLFINLGTVTFASCIHVIETFTSYSQWKEYPLNCSYPNCSPITRQRTVTTTEACIKCGFHVTQSIHESENRHLPHR